MNRFHQVALLIPALILASHSVQARELNRRLHGAYAVSYTRTCAQTAAGFSTPQLQALGPVNLSVTIVDGTHTYDGQGNFKAQLRLLTLVTTANASGSFPLTESESECTGTYQVSPDGTFSQTDTCTGPLLSGGSAGQTATTDSGLSGRVRGKTLLISEATPRPQSITFSGTGTFHRLCGRSGSGVKIDNDD